MRGLEAKLCELMEEEARCGFFVGFEFCDDFCGFFGWIWFVEDVVLCVAEICAEKAVLAGFTFGYVFAVEAVFTFLGVVTVVAVLETY